MTSSFEQLFATAVAHHDAGRADEARAAYEVVLRESPDFVPALYRLAMLLFAQNDKSAVVSLLERAIMLEPEEAELYFRLGIVERDLGRTEPAAQAFEKAAAIAPDNVSVLLKAGTAWIEANDSDRALAAFQRAAILEPGMEALSGEQSVNPRTRQEMATAVHELRELYRRFAYDSVAAIRAAYPNDDIERVVSAVNGLCGVTPMPGANPGQRPSLISIPGLPDQPWFETEMFPWAATIEAGCDAVLGEFEALKSAGAGFKPYLAAGEAVSANDTDLSSLLGSMDWNSFHLIRNGKRDEANTARCPRTTSLFGDDVPLPPIPNQSPELFFSRLEAGGHIVPHYGLTNARLTVHLALKIPPDCGIRVHHETRAWEPGKLLFFDDSYEHEAWNRSDVERVVLIFEVWNPHLTAAERFGVVEVFRQRRQWLDRFTDYPRRAPDLVFE